jgi:hypothetical protein
MSAHFPAFRSLQGRNTLEKGMAEKSCSPHGSQKAKTSLYSLCFHKHKIKMTQKNFQLIENVENKA